MKTCCGALGVPPPCPVDDSPFTTCTAAIGVASQQITQPLQAAAGGATTVVVPTAPPLALQRLRAAAPPAPAVRTEEPISTKTYRGRPGALRDGRRRLTK